MNRNEEMPQAIRFYSPLRKEHHKIPNELNSKPMTKIMDLYHLFRTHSPY
jgi:hypothetical protein